MAARDNYTNHYNNQISLRNLIDIKEWQKIQDNFSTITDIAIRTLDLEGKFLTLPSKEPRLCSEVLRNSGQKNAICGNCLPAFLGGKWPVDKNLKYSCAVGLYNFIVPVRLEENKALGYIVLGPVTLVARPPKEDYRQLAEQLGVELDELWSAIVEIKVVSLHGMQSLVELIEDVCEYTINLSYKNKMKQKEVVMAIDSSKLERLFDVLLDAAFEVSQADVGSVMYFDDAENNLTIKSSRGIPEDIVKNTRVRLGEGVSGVAAEKGTSFLIDNRSIDNRIKPYLNRPHISSSMVLPIKVENKVVGVMNLGALKDSSVRFNLDNLGVMNKLIDLVSIAISPVK